MAPRRVLLMINWSAHYTELVRAARLLVESSRYEPVVMFARSYPGFERDMAASIAEGFVTLGFDGAVVRSAPAVSTAPPAAEAPNDFDAGPSRGLTARAKGLLLTIAGYRRDDTLLAAPARTLAIRRRLRHARQVLARENISALLLASDDVGADTAEWIRAAHGRGAPAIILPFTIVKPGGIADELYVQRAHQLETRSNRLVARFFPRWAHDHHGRRLLRLPSARVLAKEVTRTAPPDPWQWNSGAADAIALESEYARAHYRSAGFPEQQLVVTGALFSDTLAGAIASASQRRAALGEQFNVDPARPLAVFALPGDLFGALRHQPDFRDYREMIEFVVATLRALGAEVLIRPHPCDDLAALDGIEATGARITDVDTALLVPLCDVFVTSASATLRWAVACGKPALNFDLFRSRFDYLAAPGTVAVETKEEFIDAASRWLGDRSALAAAATAQKDVSDRWGALDGQCGARVLALFDRLVREPMAREPMARERAAAVSNHTSAVLRSEPHTRHS